MEVQDLEPFLFLCFILCYCFVWRRL